VASQDDVHSPYGGVVPELASRRHLEVMGPVVRRALEVAGLGLAELDGLAVTQGPGLVGCLLIGCAVAKSIAYARGLPLVGVNHLEGHIYAAFLEAAPPSFPFLALVVSGGHTALYVAHAGGRYQRIGQTRDDAAGEAFDKVAKLLGLGYPGGPAIERVAAAGNARAIAFPTAQMSDGAPDFSFSGIKTAVLRYVESHQMEQAIEARRHALHPGTPTTGALGTPQFASPSDEDYRRLCDRQTLDLVVSFQAAMVSDLTQRTLAACEEYGVESLLVTGGVAANSALRAAFEQRTPAGIKVHFPSRPMSTDNAAMIAAAAYPKWLAGDFAGLDLTAQANLPLA
jgi:N6-L-threonylcarbamoyladenine synthase